MNHQSSLKREQNPPCNGTHSDSIIHVPTFPFPITQNPWKANLTIPHLHALFSSYHCKNAARWAAHKHKFFQSLLEVIRVMLRTHIVLVIRPITFPLPCSLSRIAAQNTVFPVCICLSFSDDSQARPSPFPSSACCATFHTSLSETTRNRGEEASPLIDYVAPVKNKRRKLS